jgi:hypothetical protein
MSVLHLTCYSKIHEEMRSAHASADIYKQLNKRLNTPDTSAYFVSDNSPVCNLIGILNLLLGEITLCGTDASARRREMR